MKPNDRSTKNLDEIPSNIYLNGTNSSSIGLSYFPCNRVLKLKFTIRIAKIPHLSEQKQININKRNREMDFFRILRSRNEKICTSRPICSQTKINRRFLSKTCWKLISAIAIGNHSRLNRRYALKCD